MSVISPAQSLGLTSLITTVFVTPTPPCLPEKGASPKYVQYRLGHKNIQVTMQIYQHLTNKMSTENAQLLELF